MPIEQQKWRLSIALYSYIDKLFLLHEYSNITNKRLKFVCFLPFPKVELPSPDSIENDLKALLLKLPLSGLDPCTIWFTQNAILTGKSASQHQRVREV